MQSFLTRLADWLEHAYQGLQSAVEHQPFVADYEILEFDRETLKIRVGNTVYHIDQAKRVVYANGPRQRPRVIARFSGLRRIVISGISDEEHLPEPGRWQVRLGLHGGGFYHLGEAKCQVDASILASRISTVTGLEVVAF